MLYVFSLLQPIFLHALSASIHLFLLVSVSLHWLWNKVTFTPPAAREEKSKEEKHRPNSNNTLFKTTVFCSLAVSAFSFVLCLFNYFYWYTSGWSEQNLVTFLDLALKTLAWGVVSVSLHNGFSFFFTEKKRFRFSFFFGAWCTFYLVFSCYSFVVDIVVLSNSLSAPSVPSDFSVTALNQTSSESTSTHPQSSNTVSSSESIPTAPSPTHPQSSNTMSHSESVSTSTLIPIKV